MSPTQHPSPHPHLLMMLLSCAMLLLCACDKQDENEPYPNLLTEFANLRTNSQGIFSSMTTDKGRSYLVTNTNIKPHHPNATYRAVVGYVPTLESNHPKAEIYNLTGADVLTDSTTRLRHDPTGIESMWCEGNYINMQLTAKTQGGLHHWGYAIDSVRHIGYQGREHAHHHLSIHHSQGHDPMSYYQTYYCTIIVPAIPHYQPSDTITIAVHTFSGIKKWRFLQ